MAVVENLGTNDTIGNNRSWMQSWDEMVAMTRQVPCVVLTTINSLGDVYYGGHRTIGSDINARIDKLAAMDPKKYEVVNWDGFLRGLTLGNFLHYLGPDFIHPEPAGEQWIASQDGAALQRCG